MTIRQQQIISTSFLKLILIFTLLISVSYTSESEHKHDDDNDRDFSTDAAWGWALGATLSLGLLGFLCSGIVVLVKSKTKFDFTPVIKVLVAFAAGALLGDAFIHLIPIGFGAHDHSGEDDHANQEDNEEEDKPKQGVLSLFLLLGYIVFFIFEKILLGCGFTQDQESISNDGEKTSGDIKQQEEQQDLKKNQQYITDYRDQKNIQSSKVILGIELQNKEHKTQAIQQLDLIPAIVDTQVSEKQGQQQKEKQVSLEKVLPKKQRWMDQFRGKKSEGYLNLMGDIFHNVFDGVAIGGIFYAGKTSSAVSTYIAIVAHEIPQEIGDVGLLLNSRFTNMQALFCNGFSNFSALIGAFFGLWLGQLSSNADRYISLFIAGQFIYISATDMFPILRTEKNWKLILTQLFVFALGVAALYLVLLIEEESHDHDNHDDHGDHNNHDAHDHDDHIQHNDHDNHTEHNDHDDHD